MTARVATAKPQVRAKGMVGRLFQLMWVILGVLAAAIVMAATIEIGGMLTGVWPLDHSYRVLLKEREYIGAIGNFPLTWLSPLSVGVIAADYVDSAAATAIRSTGLEQWMSTIGAYVLALVNSTKIIIHRAAVCIFVAPGYILVMCVAAIEGLVYRDIRKYTGAHESSYVFHKAKRWLVPALAITISVYLALPFAVMPVLVFAPSIALSGFMTYVAAGSFKKFM